MSELMGFNAKCSFGKLPPQPLARAPMCSIRRLARSRSRPSGRDERPPGRHRSHGQLVLERVHQHRPRDLTWAPDVRVRAPGALPRSRRSDASTMSRTTRSPARQRPARTTRPSSSSARRARDMVATERSSQTIDVPFVIRGEVVDRLAVEHHSGDLRFARPIRTRCSRELPLALADRDGRSPLASRSTTSSTSSPRSALGSVWRTMNTSSRRSRSPCGPRT